MTPKEKAAELVNKFDEDLIIAGWGETAFINSKQCALIAIDEILQIDCCDMSEENFNNHINYWVAVEKEIEKL